MDDLYRDNEPFQLTDIQQAYLIGRNSGLELGGVSSHFYLEFDCAALDISRLTAALNRVIGRHEMLRAVIDTDGRQRILADVPPYQIAVTDLRAEPSAERSMAIARIRAEVSEQMLPVDASPPFDIRATLLPGDRVRLHLGVDLLLVDVRSLLLLLRQWRRCYDDPAWSPAPLEVSFRDYVLAEQALHGEPQGEQARQYWLSRIDELPAAPEIPLAVAPERLGRPSFIRRRAIIPRQRWSALAAAAAAKGITPEALLLAAYCEVLHTWSRRREFTVTVSSLDRHPVHPRVDEIIGDFLSPSLLAVAGGAATTFAERATAVQCRLRADLAHSAFSGIRVLRELTRRRADGRAVSMPVVFTSTLGSDGDALHAFGDPVYSISRTPGIWLENQVFEKKDAIVLCWNSVSGLFPPGMLDTMFHAYQVLLDRLAEDETLWDKTGRVVPLPAAQQDERRRCNATGTDLPPARLHELVAEAARRRPEAVAVIDREGSCTHRELSQRARRLARRLREVCGAEPNSVIAVSMRPGAGVIAAMLGVLHAGAAYVVIDPELPEQRRLSLLRRCQVKAVVTEAALADRLTWPPAVELVAHDDEATLSRSAEPLESRQDYDDLAYLIFTSGSTGEPKGVMISHRSAANTVRDINQRFGVSHDDRVLALAPANFDLSVYDVFGVLGAGGAVVIPAPDRASDPAHWTELVDRHSVTIWNSVPAPMRLWIDSLGEADLPLGRSLRLALLSGDWIPTTLPGQIRSHFPEMNVVSLGGATEGSIWSVFYPIANVPPEWPSIPYGRPLANQTLHIYDDQLEQCPTWVTGEIYIGGTGIALGYWEDPERTAERFITHPVTGERLYKTGDLGRYLPGGDVEILGREDFQVKINGYRVELAEIETALAGQPGIRQALVAAPVHPHTGQRQLAAYLLADTPEAAEAAVLRQAAASLLPSYMVPSHYITIGSVPLTPNGKVDYAALPSPWNDNDEPDQRVSPRSDIEQRMLDIWSEQLGHGDLGVQDGFFDIGGDSLHAVGILGRLRSEFGISSDAEQEVIESLFTNATISDFAEILMSVTDSGS